MAYDAGSVVFTFEADTTKIDKALSDIKNAQNSLSSGGNRNPYLSDAVRSWNQQVSAARQTIRMQTQQNQLSKAGYSINSQGMASFLSDQQQLKNMLGSTMGNTATQLGSMTGSLSKITGSLSKFAPVIGVVSTGIQVVKKGVEATKKAAQNTLKYAAAAVVEIKIISSAVKVVLSTLTSIVTKSGEFIAKISGVEATINTVKSVFNELKDTVTEAFSIDNIKTFIEECNDLGSSLIEIQNVVDKVFGDNADSIDTWASNATDSLGMAEVTAKTYSATYASMLDIAGVSQKNLETMSTTLTNLTADIASFRDADMDTVFEKIKSGLSGQVRPLKEYGISMEAANIQEWMTAEGIDAVYTKLSYAEKELIRYNYLIDQTTVLHGDWTDTFYTWANQLKYFKELMNNIKSTLGQLFTGFLRPILIFVNQMLAVISTSIKSLYTELSSLFPYLFSGLEDAAKDSTDYSDILDDMEEDVKSVNDAVKRTVSSFDELHKLNDDSSSSSSSTSSLADNLDISTYETEGTNLEGYFSDLIKRIKETWKKGLTFEWLGSLVGEEINKIIGYIQEKIKTVKEKLIQAARSIATFINGLLYTVDWTKLGETIRDVLQTIQDTILTFIEELDWSAVGHAFAESIKGLFSYAFDGDGASNIITKGADLIKSSVNGFSDSVTTFLKDMSQSYITFDKKFNSTEEGLKTTYLEFGTTGKTLRTSVIDEWTYLGKQVANSINSLFDEENGIKWDQIGKNINGLVTGVLRLINTAILNIKWDEIGESFGTMIASALAPDENGNTILGKLGITINNLINGLITMIKTTLETPGVIDGMRQNIIDLFNNIDINWEDLQYIFDTVYELVKLFWSKLKEKIDWGVVIIESIKILSDLVSEGIDVLLAATLVGAASFLLGVAKWIIGKMQGIYEWVDEHILTPFVEWLVNGLSILWEEIKIDLKAFGEWFVERWAIIIEELKTDWNNIKTWLSETWTSIWTTLKNGLSNTWNSIKSKLTSAWNWLKTNIFDAIKNGVKSMLNSVISTINSLIGKLNSISFTMPDWLGGGTFGLSIPKLPLLANGGYIGADMPTAAIIGDNKNEGEIVAPESKIQENVAIALEPYMSKIESLLSTLINSSDEIHVHCEIDGDEITEIVLNNANLATARGGA